jgi:fatty-acyl-CoA synthase
MGAVLHTLNPRLLAAQIADAVERAGDWVLIVQADLVPLAQEVLRQVDGVDVMLVFGDEDVPPGAVAYEPLLAEQAAAYPWPELDEHAPAGICFTSGTTGAPKGVVYTHRALVLHALTMAAFDPYALPGRDRVLAVVPMFHAMGWNLPYISALVGASVVLPDRAVSPDRLAPLIHDEAVTFSCGVPTVWADLLRHVEAEGIELPSLRAIACGGSRVPAELMRGWDARGVTVLQGWGMTETGPGASRVGDDPGLDDEERWLHRQTAGRLRPLVEARIRSADGTLAPHDGEAFGELEVRGPLVVRGYLGDEDDRDGRFRDGWLRTGDVASIDASGWLRLVDREKDVIKSGGEWISSMDLEAALMAHPGVAQVAVIAVDDERWMERPLACVVRSGGEPVSAPSLRAHLEGRVPRWWIPERVAFVDALPTTSVGKIDKRALRDRHRAGALDVHEREDL